MFLKHISMRRTELDQEKKRQNINNILCNFRLIAEKATIENEKCCRDTYQRKGTYIVSVHRMKGFVYGAEAFSG